MFGAGAIPVFLIADAAAEKKYEIGVILPGSRSPGELWAGGLSFQRQDTGRACRQDQRRREPTKKAASRATIAFRQRALTRTSETDRLLITSTRVIRQTRRMRAFGLSRASHFLPSI